MTTQDMHAHSHEAHMAVNHTTAGFGMAAAIAIVFNTLLAWVKDSAPALEHAMKAALGHHWITHGVVDLIVFLVLGFILSKSNMAAKCDGSRLTNMLIVATILGGGGLAVWFFFV